MSEISNYEAQKKKLQGLCDEHNFTFRFFKDRYPITLVITPINDVATQMDMLGNVEETGYCSQDSSMCWYFENSELKTKVKGTFSIDKVLRTKIENMWKTAPHGLLNYHLAPADVVKIKSDTLNGNHLIKGGQHTGCPDGDWKTTIEVKPV